MNTISNPKQIIPNLFTAANMFCGFASIVNASEGNYLTASYLIVFAALFDALDGIMARLTKTSSKLGVELDSLADVISFGLAPSFLIYSIELNKHGFWGFFISSIFLIAGGYRLARFNTQLVGFDKSYFNGLPIPTAAITISSFIFLYINDNKIIEPFNHFILPISLLLSFLMVSKIKYDTLPKFSLQEIKEKPFHFVIIFISILILVFSQGKALFYIFSFIILFGIIRSFKNFVFHKSK